MNINEHDKKEIKGCILLKDKVIIEKQEKEIERLNKELDTSIEICNNRQKEIVRLNNIINELEEEISRHIALCTDVTLNDILDKLKELKGSDNNV